MKKQAIIRLLVLSFLLLNQTLLTLGLNPLPFSEEQFFTFISSVFTVFASLVVWWKNNNITKEAIESQKYLNKLKYKEPK